MITSTTTATTSSTRKVRPMNMRSDATPGRGTFTPLNMRSDLRVGVADGAIVLTGAADGAGVISVHVPVLLGTQIKTVVNGLDVTGEPRHCTDSPASVFTFTSVPSVGATQPAALVLSGLVSGPSGSSSLRVQISGTALATLGSSSAQL